MDKKSKEIWRTGETGDPLAIFDERGQYFAVLVTGYGFVDLGTWADPAQREEITGIANRQISTRNAENVIASTTGM